MKSLSANFSRRKFGTLGLSTAFLASFKYVYAGSPVPMRKNIDALTPEELENYKYAMKIVVDRGLANPGNNEGYAWQAVLHNDSERKRPDGSVGNCDHHSDLFLPWHRAHLAGFERILRATDPPRTANITLPYWDWTMPASGVRFPKAFEDPTSPLFHNGRAHKITDGSPRIQWSAQEINKFVREPDWYRFGGDPLSTGGSYGVLEDKPHNTIHGDIGPTMGSPSKAARDPIYWSFHTFIDLIWKRWQKVNVGDGNSQMFSTPDKTIWVEPFTPLVKDMAATLTMPTDHLYDYEYDFSIDQPKEVMAKSSMTDQRNLDMSDRSPDMQTTVKFKTKDANRRFLRLEAVTILADVTYRISAYVHAPSVNIKVLDADKRGSYLADFATVWQGHSHDAPSVVLDITDKTKGLADTDLVVTIVAEVVPIASDTADRMANIQGESDKLRSSGGLWKSVILEEQRDGN